MWFVAAERFSGAMPPATLSAPFQVALGGRRSVSWTALVCYTLSRKPAWGPSSGRTFTFGSEAASKLAGQSGSWLPHFKVGSARKCSNFIAPSEGATVGLALTVCSAALQ
jgi:hypothetical protein